MKILEKACIGKVEIKNRVVMAPMNVGALNNSDGTFSERAIEYFTERAKGGVGLIITGSVRVTREFERSKDTIPLWMPFADHKIHIGSITELVERCHDYGAKVAIQLSPGGASRKLCSNSWISHRTVGNRLFLSSSLQNTGFNKRRYSKVSGCFSFCSLHCKNRRG